MRLTNYTDYSLRVLMYLALQKNKGLTNIKDIAEAYGISKNHLIKVVHELGKLQLIDTVRGKGGGIRLAKKPEHICIGDVVRKMEDDFALVQCLSDGHHQCIISPVCQLQGVFQEALLHYFSVLDAYTLADIVQNKQPLEQLLQIRTGE